MHRTIARLNVLLVLSVSIHSAAAGTLLSVDVGDLSIIPNGMGHIDVMVSGSGEPVQLVGYEFRITPESGTSSQLRFVEEDESFLTSGNYLFSGNSLAVDDGVGSSVGAISTNTLPSDTFVGGDGTADLGDVSVTGQVLLVRLQVEHDAGPADPATTVGHSYAIELVPLSSDSTDFVGGSSNTGFVSAAFTPAAFASASGTVRVEIPEPASLSIAMVVATVGLCHPRRLRKLD